MNFGKKSSLVASNVYSDDEVNDGVYNATVLSYDPIIPPNLLTTEIPASSSALQTITRARRDCISIINQTDDRLLLIAGPASIHDPAAALEYCTRLKEVSDKLSSDLLIIMRAYIGSPQRSTTGWKGLISDPDIDETFQINKGLRIARMLLVNITAQGMPIATDISDTLYPRYFGDLTSVGTIGGETTESELFRAVASGLNCPVGFQNGTAGTLRVAMDAIQAVKRGHHFLSPTNQGLMASARTRGNEDGFVVLRGYYDAESIAESQIALERANLRGRLMIDCSPEGALNGQQNQLEVIESLSAQISGGQTGIMGVMITSNLLEGNQEVLPEGLAGLKKGVSITDPCLGWKETVSVLEMLAAAVRQRRAGPSSLSLPTSDSLWRQAGTRSHHLVWSDSATETATSDSCYD